MRKCTHNYVFIKTINICDPIIINAHVHREVKKIGLSISVHINLVMRLNINSFFFFLFSIHTCLSRFKATIVVRRNSRLISDQITAHTTWLRVSNQEGYSIDTEKTGWHSFKGGKVDIVPWEWQATHTDFSSFSFATSWSEETVSAKSDRVDGNFC